MKKLNIIIIVIATVIAWSCSSQQPNQEEEGWSLSAIPSSVRLDPVKNDIIESRLSTVKSNIKDDKNFLNNNWVYDGSKVKLHGARGEYVSFQLVITNNSSSELTGINVEMTPFRNENSTFEIAPELFLEWSVEVQTPSTGYPKASLGKGWYPDALIPIDFIQSDSLKVHGRWVYPFILPDFNNRIENQKSAIIWIDQFIPTDNHQLKAGQYTSQIAVNIGDKTQKIPVELQVWNFDLPNENLFKASLQQEGFLSRMSDEKELKIYQLFKRNRVSLMDPTYEPDLQYSKNGEVTIGWDTFDKRLGKYLTGAAFTESHGYKYGPGYGEPIETFTLPFDVYGKHETREIGRAHV